MILQYALFALNSQMQNGSAGAQRTQFMYDYGAMLTNKGVYS